MPRSNKRNEEDDEDDSVDVKTIKSLIKRTRSESDLKTLNVMLEKAKAEDREKKFAALKAKYSTGSGDATQYDDSLLDVVGVDSPLPPALTSKKPGPKPGTSDVEQAAAPKATKKVTKKSGGKKKDSTDDFEFQTPLKTPAKTPAKRKRKPGRQATPIDTGVNTDDADYEQDNQELSDTDDAPMKKKRQTKASSTKKRTSKQKVGDDEESTAFGRPDLNWCSSGSEDEGGMSRKKWTDIELATAYTVAEDFKDIVRGHWPEKMTMTEKNRLRRTAYLAMKERINAIAGRKRRKKHLYYKLIDFKSTTRSKAKLLSVAQKQSGGQGITDKDKLTHLEVLAMKFYGPECCGVIPGSWKRPADADESLERVETSADMLKHMKQAEIEQREAKDKAKEDGKRQRRVQKEMYGLHSAKKEENVENEGSTADDEAEPDTNVNCKPTQLKNRLKLKARKLESAVSPIVISPGDGEGRRSSERIRNKTTPSPAGPTPPSRSSGRIASRIPKKENSITNTLNEIFQPKRQLDYSGVDDGFTAISTPLPQADAEVDEEQGSAYHVKITKPTRKPVDRTTKLAKFVPPKDSDVINLIDAVKEPKTAAKVKREPDTVKENVDVIAADVRKATENMQTCVTVLIDDVKRVQKDTSTLGHLNNEVVGMANELKGLVVGHNSMRADFDTVHANVWCQKKEVTTIKNDVSLVKADVSTSKTDVHVVKGQVGSLSTDIQDVKVDVASLCSDVNTLKGEVSMCKVDIQEIESDIRCMKGDLKNVKASLYAIAGTLDGVNMQVNSMGKNLQLLGQIKEALDNLAQPVQIGSLVAVKVDEDAEDEQTTKVIAIDRPTSEGRADNVQDRPDREVTTDTEVPQAQNVKLGGGFIPEADPQVQHTIQSLEQSTQIIPDRAVPQHTQDLEEKKQNVTTTGGSGCDGEAPPADMEIQGEIEIPSLIHEGVVLGPTVPIFTATESGEFELRGVESTRESDPDDQEDAGSVGSLQWPAVDGQQDVDSTDQENNGLPTRRSGRTKSTARKLRIKLK